MSIVRDTAENPSSEKVRLGAGCRVNPPPPVVEENFLLTSPFIESPDVPITGSPDLALGFVFGTPLGQLVADSGSSRRLDGIINLQSCFGAGDCGSVIAQLVKRQS